MFNDKVQPIILSYMAIYSSENLSTLEYCQTKVFM